jgi:hypothetical protein
MLNTPSEFYPLVGIEASGLPVGQQLLLNTPGVVAGKNSALSQVSFSLAGFFGKNMAEVLLFILNLASPGK